MTGRIAVVGAGMAGLAAAAAAAAHGHRVTLLEAEVDVGGVARRVEAAGARVDLGPTILTDLAPLRALADRVKTPLHSGAALIRVDPGVLVTFPGGVRLPLSADPSWVGPAVRALGPHAPADWDCFLDLGARALRLAEHFYARGDVLDARDHLRFLMGGGASLRDAVPFVRHRSLRRLLRAEVRTAALRALLGHFARLLGLGPDQAPAVAIVVPYLLVTSGVWYPRGGLSTLAEVLLDAAVKRGATLVGSARVAGLDVRGGRVRAVRTARGEVYEVDACIAAVDVGEAARWAGDPGLIRGAGRLRPALTARVAWWVVEGRPPLAVHHALHFDRGEDAEPLYVATPTVTEPGLAPSGVNVVYALQHGAPGAEPSAAVAEDWRTRVEAAGQWPGGSVLASGISGGGASCYGYALRPGLVAGLPPSQRMGSVANLFLAGQSVFPGPGVANVLRSGLRAAALADAALQRAGT